jgi:hypothetical protein
MSAAAEETDTKALATLEALRRAPAGHGRAARNWCKSLWACSTLPRQGVRHTRSRGTRWGCGQDAGPSALSTHRPPEKRPQAEDPTRAAGIHEGDPHARSGGGPRKGFLADTRWSNRGWVHRELQMPEDLADHLALRDGGHDPQRPLLAARAACHIQGKDALAQLRPDPVRRPGVRRLLVQPLLARRGDGRPARAGRPSRRTVLSHRRAPSAACFWPYRRERAIRRRSLYLFY